MGACYSRKAGGGNFSYTTVPMASTKLDDNSCRPMPYSRNISSSPSVNTKKGIPISNKFDHAFNKNDPKNLKIQNAFSSIPRFNASPIAVSKTEFNENVANANPTNKVNRNENNMLHIANNNCVITSQSENNVTRKSNNPQGSMESLKNTKISPSSISCPGDVSGNGKNNNIKMKFSRIPAKFGLAKSSLPSPSVSKSVRSVSPAPMTSESNLRLANGNNSKMKQPQGQGSKLSVQKTSQELSSVTTSESRDSIADSGLGNSIYTDKHKQEDADTLKDLELMESDVFSSGNYNKSSSEEQIPKSDDKTGLKFPSYKRNWNGKWSIDPKEEQNIYKTNCPTTTVHHSYAMYKGLSKKPLFKNDFEALNALQRVKTEVPNSSKSLNLNTASKALKSPVKKHLSSPVTYKSVADSSRQGNISPMSDDKSEGIGSDTKSPPSESENRDFLIDDEIADQPTLISCSNERIAESPVPSLQQSVTELHALQMSSTNRRNSDFQGSKSGHRERLGSDHRDSLLLSSEMGSSCSSIASDDLMLDFDRKIDLTDCTLTECATLHVYTPTAVESIDDQITDLGQVNTEERSRKRLFRRASGSVCSSTGKDEWRLRSVSLPLRPPRPMSVTETDDGSIILDASSYRLLSQDLTVVKTLLLRLKSVVQEAETINPFDQGSTKNLFYSSLAHGDLPPNLTQKPMKGNEALSEDLFLENADLRRQIVLLHQQAEEKDRTIHLLQQQMTKYTNAPCTAFDSMQCVNAATQTERPKLTSSLSSSAAGSSETLVSVQHAFEEHVSQSLVEQESFREQIEEMSRSLNSLNQNLSAVVASSPPSNLKKYYSTEL